jgi:hypothetical protein
MFQGPRRPLALFLKESATAVRFALQSMRKDGVQGGWGMLRNSPPFIMELSDFSEFL